MDDITHNLDLAQDPLVKDVAASATGTGALRASAYHSQVFRSEPAVDASGGGAVMFVTK